LELFQYFAPNERRDRAVRPCDVGSSHLCFVVNDMDSEVERLRNLGAEFLSEPQTVEAGPNAGNRFCYFLDPDGIPMELSQPAEK
jgi:catechol 2,3-dioxygenase-like lactoylglutathione lyase family enzyme